MGQASDDIINGICCQECGQWMPDVVEEKKDIFINPPGHPRTCPDCDHKAREDHYNQAWAEKDI